MFLWLFIRISHIENHKTYYTKYSIQFLLIYFLYVAIINYSGVIFYLMFVLAGYEILYIH
jgi:hypothetical protein